MISGISTDQITDEIQPNSESYVTFDESKDREEIIELGN